VSDQSDQSDPSDMSDTEKRDGEPGKGETENSVSPLELLGLFEPLERNAGKAFLLT